MQNEIPVIKKHQLHYPVSYKHQALGVARSGYHARQKHQQKGEDRSHRALIEHIRRIYGSLLVCATLRASGLVYNHKCVARLMQQESLYGRRKCHKVVTTDNKHSYPIAHNLLNRQFLANEPDAK